MTQAEHCSTYAEHRNILKDTICSIPYVVKVVTLSILLPTSLDAFVSAFHVFRVPYHYLPGLFEYVVPERKKKTSKKRAREDSTSKPIHRRGSQIRRSWFQNASVEASRIIKSFHVNRGIEDAVIKVFNYSSKPAPPRKALFYPLRCYFHFALFGALSILRSFCPFPDLSLFLSFQNFFPPAPVTIPHVIYIKLTEKRESSKTCHSQRKNSNKKPTTEAQNKKVSGILGGIFLEGSLPNSSQLNPPKNERRTRSRQQEKGRSEKPRFISGESSTWPCSLPRTRSLELANVERETRLALQLEEFVMNDVGPRELQNKRIDWLIRELTIAKHRAKSLKRKFSRNAFPLVSKGLFVPGSTTSNEVDQKQLLDDVTHTSTSQMESTGRSDLESDTTRTRHKLGRVFSLKRNESHPDKGSDKGSQKSGSTRKSSISQTLKQKVLSLMKPNDPLARAAE